MTGRVQEEDPKPRNIGIGGRGVYTDGSRLQAKTAATTITRVEYLGRYAKLMDAEMLAVAMGWELGDTVITDSQAAIGGIENLQLKQPRGWIEERVVAAAG